MKTVLPDTNIILWTFSGGVDFIQAINEAAPEYKIAIPLCVISELSKIGTRTSKAALNMCEPIEKIDIGDGYTDDMLVRASERGYLIATNDRNILKVLKTNKRNALRIRERHKLVFTEGG